MNESLAKQLHDLINGYKIAIEYAVNDELTHLEEDVNILIKNKTHEEK